MKSFNLFIIARTRGVCRSPNGTEMMMDSMSNSFLLQ